MTHLIPGTDKDYFAFDATNSSKLKEATKSMKHFFEYKPTKPTPAMRLGTMFHEAVLYGLSYFYNKYSRLPQGHNGRTKVGKAYIECIEEAGMEPVKYDEWQAVLDMHKLTTTHPTVKDALNDSIEIEQGFWWEHESGLKLKCKPDLVSKDKNGNISCFDLKKTRNASDRGFLNAVRDFGYDVQCALYVMGLKERFGDAFDWFHFVMVSPPSGIGIYYLPPAYIETVQAWINEALWQIQEIKAKELPTYSYSNPEIDKGIKGVEMPDYMWNKYLT